MTYILSSRRHARHIYTSFCRSVMAPRCPVPLVPSRSCIIEWKVFQLHSSNFSNASKLSYNNNTNINLYNNLILTSKNRKYTSSILLKLKSMFLKLSTKIQIDRHCDYPKPSNFLLHVNNNNKQIQERSIHVV